MKVEAPENKGKAMKVVAMVHSTLVPDTSKPLSYTAVRSVFSVEERVQQTVETVASLRRHLPAGARIVVADNSRALPEDAVARLHKAGLNMLVSCYDAATTDSPHKGLGVARCMMAAIEAVDARPEWRDFDMAFVLAGRYHLTPRFHMDRFRHDKIVFHQKPDGSGFNNILYGVPATCWRPYKDAMRAIVAANSPEMYETQLRNATQSVSAYVDTIGTAGRIAVDGNHIDL